MYDRRDKRGIMFKGEIWGRKMYNKSAGGGGDVWCEVQCKVHEIDDKKEWEIQNKLYSGVGGGRV